MLTGHIDFYHLSLLESDTASCIYIAMAGTHQIWAHFLRDSKWIKGRCGGVCGFEYWIQTSPCFCSEYKSGATVRFTGSGEEANRNNSYPHKACFAQPSEISIRPGEYIVLEGSLFTVACLSKPCTTISLAPLWGLLCSCSCCISWASPFSPPFPSSSLLFPPSQVIVCMLLTVRAALLDVFH